MLSRNGKEARRCGITDIEVGPDDLPCIWRMVSYPDSPYTKFSITLHNRVRFEEYISKHNHIKRIKPMRDHKIILVMKIPIPKLR